MSIKIHRGDTLIEVSFAIVVFCVISILSVGLMNRNLSIAQGALELNMARNEIDAQAEALRFIHDSYTIERAQNSSNQEYSNLWSEITNHAVNPDSIPAFNAAQCSAYYGTTIDSSNPIPTITTNHAFILNTRSLDKRDENGNIDPSQIIFSATSGVGSIFFETSLYPRLIFTGNDNAGADTPTSGDDSTEDPDDIDDGDIEQVTDGGQGSSDDMTELATYDNLSRAEGIWVIAVNDGSGNSSSEFYDFHIRTCWYAPGHDLPSTIATIVRLYNPNYGGNNG
jgi:hypothetical protein